MYITINDIVVNVPMLLGYSLILFAIIYVMLLAVYGVSIIVGAVEKMVVTQYRRYAFKKMMAEAIWK